MQPLCALDIVRIHVLGPQLPGRGVAPVVNELAAATREVGHEGDARRAPLKHMHSARIHSVARKAVEHALAEVVRTHAADEARSTPQPRHAVNIDARVAAGEGSDKGAGAVHGLVKPGAHDFDKHGANADDIGARRHGSIL